MQPITTMNIWCYTVAGFLPQIYIYIYIIIIIIIKNNSYDVVKIAVMQTS